VKIRGIRGKKTKLCATPQTPPNSALKTFEQSEKKKYITYLSEAKIWA